VLIELLVANDNFPGVDLRNLPATRAALTDHPHRRRNSGRMAQASPATPAAAAQSRYTASFPSLGLCEERGRQDIGGRVQKFRRDEVPGQRDLYEFTSP
jgi:hypothetical protein